MKEKYTLLDYVAYSQAQCDFIMMGVYILTDLLRHEYGLKPTDDLKEVTEGISTEDVLSLIEKYGCGGFEVY